MEKPAQFKPSFITKNFFPEYINDPQDINRGHCYDWAYVSYCLYESVQLWSTPSGLHAWVQVGKKFFDSETKFGRKEWWNLPIFQRMGGFRMETKLAKQMSLWEFRKCWNLNGRYHRNHTMWEGMRERITSQGLIPIRT